MQRYPIIRMARPTDRLEAVAKMYREGLGLEETSRFDDHNGFDGVILSGPEVPWQIEFTACRHEPAGGAPSPDHLWVFYLPERADPDAACARMERAGFRS